MVAPGHWEQSSLPVDCRAHAQIMYSACWKVFSVSRSLPTVPMHNFTFGIPMIDKGACILILYSKREHFIWVEYTMMNFFFFTFSLTLRLGYLDVHREQRTVPVYVNTFAAIPLRLNTSWSRIFFLYTYEEGREQWLIIWSVACCFNCGLSVFKIAKF